MTPRLEAFPALLLLATLAAPAQAAVLISGEVRADNAENIITPPADSSPLVLRAWAPGVPDTPDGLRQLAPFAQSAATTLADWRFQRAEGNSKGRPLITTVVFLFARDARTDLAALRRECLVGDLRDFVYLKTDAGYRRGNLNKGLLERQRAEYPPTIPDGCTRHPGWCD